MDKNKDGCEICGKKFNAMFVSEHQCKRCSRNICKECCTKKKPIYTKNSMKLEEHRCCDACIPVSTANFNHIKQNNTIFLSDSQIAKEWVELSNIDVLPEEEKQTLPLSQKISSIKIAEIWPQLTDTMRELLGISLGKMPIAQAEDFIQRIITKHKLKFNQEQSLLLLYIMCHAGESSSVKVFKYLMDILSSVKEKRIIEILGLNLQNSTSSSTSQNKTDKVLKNIVLNTKNELIQSFFLDVFPTTIVNEILLEVLLAGTPTYIENILAWLITEYSSQFISSASIAQVKIYIYKNIDQQKFTNGLKSIRKKQLQKEKITKSVEISSSDNRTSSPQKSFSKPNSLSQSNQTNEKQRPSEKKQEKVMKKINEAAQFLRKLESGELNEEEINLDDMENLNAYLDQVIAQNDQAIKECEHFDELLSGIQEEMYKSNGQSMGL